MPELRLEEGRAALLELRDGVEAEHRELAPLAIAHRVVGRGAGLRRTPEQLEWSSFSNVGDGCGTEELVPADDEKPDLLEALMPVKTELRCAACGYGVVAREAPESCPMCQSTEWEPVLWRPFSRRSDFPETRRAAAHD